MNKTFYLWDLADTLFFEKWNKEKSGLESYDGYVKSLGFDPKTINPRDYEWAYERPYKEGLFDLEIAKGFREVLSWTKNNAVFTTGNREQVDWRAEYLNPKAGFDIRDYIKEIYTTFDYGNANVKTADMIKNILLKKHAQGFDIFVYTDDKLENCQFFHEAAKDHPHRVYHILNDNHGLRKKSWHWEAGSLYDIIKNEKICREQ